jgi:CBS domain-containing protein
MASSDPRGIFSAMKIHDVMTSHAECISPDTSLIDAAKRMRELDVGGLPICDHDRLAGMVTDRDLVIRGLAEARDPHTATVRDVMSPGIVYIFEDQDAEEAARVMEVKQIRRLPVLNREKRLVGIVSLGDLAVDASFALSGEALKEISQPVHHAGR